MDKLTLEHLSAYLPWELKVQYQGITNLKELSEHNKKEPKGWNVLDADYISWANSTPKGIIGTRVSVIKKIEFYKTHVRLYVGKRHGYLKLVWFNEIKPLLHPLSIQFLTSVFPDANILEEVLLAIEQDKLLQIRYDLFTELVKNHGDVYGLIHRGLAVEIKEGV